MRIECENCKAVYNIDDGLLSDQPIGAQCPYCGHVKVVSADAAPGAMPGLEPAGVPSPPSVAPFGGEIPPFGAPAPAPAPGGFAPPAAPQSSEMMGGVGMGGLAPEAEDEQGLMGGGAASLDQRFGAPDGARAAVEIGAGPRCQVCGVELVDEFDKVLGVCETHQREQSGHPAAAAGAAKEWRVKRADGEIVGPFSLGEIREQIKAGQLGQADDLFSIDSIEFKPMNEFSELRVFEKGSAALGFAGTAEVAGTARPNLAPHRGGPSLGLGTILFILSVLVAGAAGAYYATNPEKASAFLAKLTKTGDGESLLGKSNPLDRKLPKWRTQHPNVGGTPEEYLVSANVKFLEDRWSSYQIAEDALKKALLLDSDNPEAVALYVENHLAYKGAFVSPDELKILDGAVRFITDRSPDVPSVHRAKAALELINGDLNGARAAAERALQLDATDGRAKLLLASSYVEGNYDLAIVEGEKALTIVPDLRRADRLLARAYANGGRYSAALETLEKRLRKDPTNAAVLTLYGDINRDLGRLSRAADRYRAATTSKGDRLSPRLALAELEMERKAYDTAAAHFRKVAVDESAPNRYRVRAYAGWSRASFLSRSFRRSAQLADEALALNPRSAVALVTKAEIALETRSATTAKALAEKALQVRAGEPAALVVLGRVAIDQGKLADAVKALEEATVNDPRDPRLRALLASAYLKFNSATQAFTVLRRAGEIDPRERDSRQRKGVVSVSDFAIREAINRFREAAREDRNRAVSFAAVGMLHYHSGRNADAKPAFLRALKADDTNVVTLLYDAQIAFDQGRMKRARASTKRILSIERSSVMGHLMMGRLELKKKRYREAREHLETAARLRKGFTPAEVELAAIDLAEGREKEAISTLAKAYRINPHSLRVRQLLLRAGY